ncbi:MAG TPA: DUF1349 domain-containing protein [Rectinemataceae bacterium]|nr:DUF1349 domain-containing protein [Rectinemataceae bacterium]
MLTMNRAVTISETKDAIEIIAPAESDFFIDSDSGKERAEAPFYYERASGDFTARVAVRPAFKKKYDAGGLFVFDSASKWIKLEFELTDLGHPSVVSVVTDTTSDDANGERLDGAEEIRLQIARRGDLWVLHYSLDGRKWKMVRYFRLKMKRALRVGLEAQSPVGRGCSVTFRAYSLVPGAPADMRKGR